MRDENEIKELHDIIKRYKNDIQKEKVERRDRKIDEILGNTHLEEDFDYYLLWTKNI